MARKAKAPYTPFQIECLRALAHYPNGWATAAQIAHTVVHFRRKRGEPTVGWKALRFGAASAMRSLLHRTPDNPTDESDDIVRCGPRDQWDAATWHLTPKTRAVLASLDAEGESGA